MTAVPIGSVDLTTMLADVLFTNPVMVASGCGGNGRDLSRFCDLTEIGAFVTPSVTREASSGDALPRLVETPSGLLSAVGLPGLGIDAFLATDLPWLLRHDVRPVVSIAGTTLGEYAELARRVGNTPGIAGIEINLGHEYRRDVVHASRAVAVVRREAAPGVPVFAKLWPGSTPVAELADAVVDAGADAVVLTGTLPGLAVEQTTLQPRLGAVVGELSGAAIRPVGMLAVWEVRRALPEACIVAVGGVGSGADALEYLAAGADAVQVGSALFRDPATGQRVVSELRAALAAHGFESPRQARGAAHRPTAADAARPSINPISGGKS